MHYIGDRFRLLHCFYCFITSWLTVSPAYPGLHCVVEDSLIWICELQHEAQIKLDLRHVCIILIMIM